MATTKSYDIEVLLEHVFVYGLTLAVGLLFFYPAILFVAVNIVLHFMVDFVTSKITAFYWKADRRHAFFVTIGADQFIHTFFLISTLPLLL